MKTHAKLTEIEEHIPENDGSQLWILPIVFALISGLIWLLSIIFSAIF